MSKHRNYRKKQVADDDETEDTVSESLEERKELQKYRHRTKGVNVEDLSVFKKTEDEENETLDDPFKIKSGGGLTEMDPAKTVTDLSKFGTEFSSETNQRDEDLQLLKYIEDEMKKKKGVKIVKQEKKDLTKEDLLFQLPDSINVKSAIKSEEMLSSQMLSGIPEVDLGIDAKIKNIEATEEAKSKMIEDSKNRKDLSSAFVPTNMASNFMHHSRFYDEKQALEKEKKKEQAKKLEQSNTVIDKGPTVGNEIVDTMPAKDFLKQAMNPGTGNNKRKKQTTDDDYMFEKFKNRAKTERWR